MFSLLHICPLRENQWRIFKSLALNLRVVRKSKRSLRVLCSIISPRVKTEKIYIFLVLYVCVVRKSEKNHFIFYTDIFVCNNVRKAKINLCFVVLQNCPCEKRNEKLAAFTVCRSKSNQKFVYSLFCKPCKAY